VANKKGKIEIKIICKSEKTRGETPHDSSSNKAATATMTPGNINNREHQQQ